MEHISPELIRRYHAGNCTPEEKRDVEAWLGSDDNLLSNDIKTEIVFDHDLEAEILGGAQQRLVVAMSNKKAKVRRLWISTAAAACITGIVAMGMYYFSNNKINTSAENIVTNLQTYTVAKGKRASITLPDSSVVHLMGGTTISFPEKFAGTTRDLVLERGEIFLEVTRRPDQAFIVHSSGTEVKVLGTKFNIRNTEQEPVITVALTEGRIQFSGKYSTPMILRPGEILRYDKPNDLVTEVRNFKEENVVMGWTRGKLYFDKQPLHEVLNRMEDYYGVQFVLKEKVNLNIPFTLKIDNHPLQKILSMMEYSVPLQFSLVGKTVEVRPSIKE